MEELRCKKCGNTEYIKNGSVRGHQRYKCKICGHNFTDTPFRGKSTVLKALAILLYTKGNMRSREVAKLLGVTDVSVLNWVRHEARNSPDLHVLEDAQTVTFDEVSSYLKDKQKRFDREVSLTQLNGELFSGCWISVTMMCPEN